ncbi:unnamed protein product, partial [Iphiclides podalirius]
MEALLTKDSIRTSDNEKPRVKLTQLEIPRFGGDLHQWPAFKAFFMSTVDEGNLPVITKLQYLKSSLQSLDSLRAIKLPVDSWDAILVFFICQKLDNSLRAAWELNPLQSTT